jgi:putative hydrolase of the HAD superfamily
MKAVVFDFYGTLGESAVDEWWLEEALVAHGYALDRAAEVRWSSNSWDGREHHEHSRSAEHYAAWERERFRGLLGDCGVPAAEVDTVVAEIEARRDAFRMACYADSVPVLEELRAAGVRLAICSNWDWDLDEQLEACGVAPLVDARVSSAWVGVRKPHPLIFEKTLAELGGVDPADAVFVGDNWHADVEGPLAAGFGLAVHVWRWDEHPGDYVPVPPDVPADGRAVRVPDLRPLPSLVL